jgi:hypothetical protein
MDDKKPDEKKEIVLEVQNMKHKQATKLQEGKNGQSSNRRRN